MIFNLISINNISSRTLIIMGAVLVVIVLVLYYFYKNFMTKKVVENEDVKKIDESIKESDVGSKTPQEPIIEGVVEKSQQSDSQVPVDNIETFEEAMSDIFFDVNIDGKEKTIIFRLYDEEVPKTCTNFRELARTGKYNKCKFHRIIKDFMIQGGDFQNGDGTGGESIYGPNFKDENLTLKHEKPGLLSMANSGPDTNGSQFFITTVATPHLDGKHVVFGEVIKGMEVVKEMEALETDDNDSPKVECIIASAGLVTNQSGK